MQKYQPKMINWIVVKLEIFINQNIRLEKLRMWKKLHTIHIYYKELVSKYIQVKWYMEL